MTLEPLAVAIVNHKGGVGKTTIAHVMAQIAVQRGMKVAAYDLDLQRNLTDSLSLVELSGLNIRTRINEGDENDSNDIYILDCPPALSSVTDKAIAFADLVLVPVFPNLYSVTNLDMLYTRVKNTGKIREQIAIVKNCFDETALSRDLDAFLAEKGYSIAGRLPQNKRLRANISTGLVWNYSMSARNQTPFAHLFDRTLRAFKELDKGNPGKAW